jgi:hypothetical protein
MDSDNDFLNIYTPPPHLESVTLSKTISSAYCTVTMILSIVKLNFNKMQREETIKSKIMELSVDQSVRLCKNWP